MLKNVQQNVLRLLKSTGIKLLDLVTFTVLIALFLFSTSIIDKGYSHASAELVRVETYKGTKFFKLGEERLVTVKGDLGEITIEVGRDFVRVVSSPCKDKYCIKQGKISNAGESIICLPGKAKISIEGKAFTDSVNR